MASRMSKYVTYRLRINQLTNGKDEQKRTDRTIVMVKRLYRQSGDCERVCYDRRWPSYTPIGHNVLRGRS